MHDSRQCPTAVALKVATVGFFATLALGDELRAQIPALARSQCLRDVPDPSVACGKTYLVATVNSQIVVQHKNQLGGVTWWNYLDQSDQTATTKFFGGCPPTASNTSGFFEIAASTSSPPLTGTRIVDTKTLYDQYADRYVVLGLQSDSASVPTGSPSMFVAYSKTEDPRPTACSGSPSLGGWNRHFVLYTQTVSGVSTIPDYNGLGVNDDYVVYTGILVDSTRTARGHVYTCLLKSELAKATGPATGMSLAEQTGAVTNIIVPGRVEVNMPQPAHCFGPSDIYLVGINPGAVNSLLVSVLDPTGTTKRYETSVAVQPFTATSIAVPQFDPGWGTATPPNPVPLLDEIDSRIMNAVVRDGKLYTCHTIAAPDGAGGFKNVVRLYTIDLNGFSKTNPTNAPTQALWGNVDMGSTTSGGVTAPIHTWMPAIGVDKHGNIATVFSRCSAVEYPWGWRAGRLTTDPVSTGTTSAVMRWSLSSTNATAWGTNVPYSPFPWGTTTTTTIARWGDYAGIAVDPVTDDVFYSHVQGVRNAPPATVFRCTGSFNTNSWITYLQHFSYDIPGSVTTYTPGYPNPGYPNLFLNTGDPRIGSTLTFTIQNSSGVANTLAYFLIGARALPPQPYLGGTSHVDLTASFSLTTLLLPTNGLSLPVAVPATPALIGVTNSMQVLQVDTSLPPDNLSFTNGLGVKLGSQ